MPRSSLRVAQGEPTRAGYVSAAGQIPDFTADFRLLLGALGDGQRKARRDTPRQRRRRSPVASVSSDMRSLSPSRTHRSGRSAASVCYRRHSWPAAHGCGRYQARSYSKSTRRVRWRVELRPSSALPAVQYAGRGGRGHHRRPPGWRCLHPRALTPLRALLSRCRNSVARASHLRRRLQRVCC